MRLLKQKTSLRNNTKKIKKRKDKVRGAVSVFLVLILVPCIVVTSVFVDLGRVHMSKGLAESAADLALNTLMTNYDGDLSEWYGMVASCQTIEEFYDASALFFLRTVSSQGLSDEEIVLLSDYYAHVTNDDTIYDLLQVECQTEPSAMISEVSGANLANATLIKDQIVEFMKYRGPIEISTGLFQSLIDQNKVAGTNNPVKAVVEANENKKVVDEKTQFYTAEGELLEAAVNSYKAIKAYHESAKASGLSNATLLGYIDQINGYREAYKEIHGHIVSNLLNTSGLTAYSRYTTSLDEYRYIDDEGEVDSAIYSRKEKVKDEESEEETIYYYMSEWKIDSLLDGLESAISSFRNEVDRIGGNASYLLSNLPGSSDDEAHTVQWWVQMDSAIGSESIESEADALVDAHARVFAMSACEAEDDVEIEWESRRSDLLSEAASLHSSYLTSGGLSSGDSYLEAVGKLEEVSSSDSWRLNATNLLVSVDGSSRNLDEALSYISTKLNEIKTKLKTDSDLLDIAINGKGKTKSLDKLADLADTYSTEFGEWKDEAEKAKTDLQQFDLKSINQQQENPRYNVDKSTEKINRAAVTELKTRLTNIKSQLDAVIEIIDDLEYGKDPFIGSAKKVKDITNVATMKDRCTAEISQIKLKNGELKAYCESSFDLKPSSPASLSHTGDNKYNPDINPAEDNTVETPELYVHFESVWKDENLDKVSELKEEETKANDEVKEYEKGEKEKASKYRGEGEDIVRDFSGTTAYGVTDIYKIFGDLVKLDFTSARDNIYATTYIMEMFSWATFDYEGMYKLLKEKDAAAAKQVTPKNIIDENYYDTKGIKGATDAEKTWLSEKVTDSYNKTLTMKLINKEHNEAYLAEVEYILYGACKNTSDSTYNANQENIKSAFGQIYTMRYALNLISCFQHFWTDMTIGNISLTISSMTGGIIPVPVIKVVLLPILTAIETVNDNKRLSAGLPVELYKTQADMWRVAVWRVAPLGEVGSYSAFFTSLTSGDINAGKENPDGFAFYYSDYLMVFLYAALAGGDDLEKQVYLRTAELIQSNLRKHDEIPDTYSLKKARMYFNINAEMRVKPLMITLPIFNDYENNLTEKTDWCTYRVRKTRGYT